MNTHSHNIPQWDRGGSIHASPNQAVGENRDEMSQGGYEKTLTLGTYLSLKGRA
ncbi:hypothetical protein FOXYSP1_05027 [Fusarium oxysporum f. sp. phaseoli]